MYRKQRIQETSFVICDMNNDRNNSIIVGLTFLSEVYKVGRVVEKGIDDLSVIICLDILLSHDQRSTTVVK